MKKTDLISCFVIGLCAGIFIGFILTSVFIKNVFTDEIIVKMQPMGTRQYPYYPYHQYFTNLPYEDHLVKIKNGNVVNVERLGFSYD